MLKLLASFMVVVHLLTVCASFAQEEESAPTVPKPNALGILIAGAATVTSGLVTYLFYKAGNETYEKYENATTYADAQKHRVDAENADTWRNVMMGTTGLALVVTGYLYYRHHQDKERYERQTTETTGQFGRLVDRAGSKGTEAGSLSPELAPSAVPVNTGIEWRQSLCRPGRGNPEWTTVLSALEESTTRDGPSWAVH
jgi:hypothetical protein